MSAHLADPTDVNRLAFASLAAAAVLGAGGCAALTELQRFVLPPRFTQAQDRPAEIRLLGPGGTAPLGAAGVRVWTEVYNPNPFGVTISTLRTTLTLDGRRAAEGEFPLGLPLAAQQESVVPIELTIDFSDLPALVGVVRRAVGGQPVAYQLDGTIGVDAGRLGQPVFGPLRLAAGEVGGPRRSQ